MGAAHAGVDSGGGLRAGVAGLGPRFGWFGCPGCPGCDDESDAEHDAEASTTPTFKHAVSLLVTALMTAGLGSCMRGWQDCGVGFPRSRSVSVKIACGQALFKGQRS